MPGHLVTTTDGFTTLEHCPVTASTGRGCPARAWGRAPAVLVPGSGWLGSTASVGSDGGEGQIGTGEVNNGHIPAPDGVEQQLTGRAGYHDRAQIGHGMDLSAAM